MAILKGQPSLLTYDTTKGDAQQIGVGLGCKGLIRILLVPIDPADPHNPVEVLKQCLGERKEWVLLSLLESNDPAAGDRRGQLFREQSLCARHFPDELAAPLAALTLEAGTGRASRVATFTLSGGRTYQFLAEYLPPPLRLLIYGGNYDVVPLLGLAAVLGWECQVFARAHRTDPQISALAPVTHAPYPQPRPDPHTLALLMAHDYDEDLANLRALAPLRLPYLGLLGPRKRFEQMQADLGPDFPCPPGLHNPAGLDLGANSPQEIALSILAEIRAVFSRRPAGFLRDRKGPIHERPAG
jgi:xanthine/CO dehydrogenase XdhC/CoxF family maturation factor